MTSSSPVGTRAAVLEPVDRDADAGHGAVLALAEDLDRRAQEAQLDPVRLARRLARGVVAEHLHVAPGRRASRARSPPRPARVAERRRRARSSPSSRTSGLVNAACAGPRRPSSTTSSTVEEPKRVERVVGRVGRRELVGVEHEHARDVDRHVAVADHDRAAAGEVELVARVLGMAVVPGDELGGRVRAGAVLAGDAEPVVVGGPDRVEDRVVAVEQLVRARRDRRARPRRRSGSPASPPSSRRCA